MMLYIFRYFVRMSLKRSTHDLSYRVQLSVQKVTNALMRILEFQHVIFSITNHQEQLLTSTLRGRIGNLYVSTISII